MRKKLDIKKIEKAVEVEDNHILLDLPFIYEKYGKQIEIKPIKWLKWETFTYYMVLFLEQYYVICANAKVPENLLELKNFHKNIQSVLSSKAALKCLLKMAGFYGLKKRWLVKNFDLFDYAELFCYMYAYNILGVKKKLTDALKLIKSL